MSGLRIRKILRDNHPNPIQAKIINPMEHQVFQPMAGSSPRYLIEKRLLDANGIVNESTFLLVYHRLICTQKATKIPALHAIVPAY
jgi:hypothetical protein